MSTPQILVYGANGRIARLIHALAAERGIPLVAAGRNAQRIDATNGDGGGDARIFGLSTPSTIDDCLEDIKVVLNCAGPSEATGPALFDACLRRGVDYLDLSDSVHVVEAFRSRDDEIKEAQIMVLPSVGFSAVAGDCLALHLAERLPEARELDLVFCHGRADAAHDGHDAETFVRREHRLVHVAAGGEARRFACGDELRLATPTTAVELCTTHVSTNIPNITVWRTVTQVERWTMRAVAALPKTAGIGKGAAALVRMSRDLAARRAHSPDPTATIIAIATGPAGETIAVRLETLDTAVFTAHAALQIALRVAKGTRSVGFATPAALFGPDFVLTLPGVKRT